MNIENMSNALTEVQEIVFNLPVEDYNKIPKQFLKLIDENCNSNYDFVYNKELSLKEQNISREAIVLIYMIFRDYLSTPEQKSEMIEKEIKIDELAEEMKRQTFNPDDIFKRKNSNIIVENQEKSLNNIDKKEIIFIDKKKNIFTRFWIKIKMKFSK